jgi:hypothetical protein
MFLKTPQNLNPFGYEIPPGFEVEERLEVIQNRLRRFPLN